MHSPRGAQGPGGQEDEGGEEEEGDNGGGALAIWLKSRVCKQSSRIIPSGTSATMFPHFGRLLESEKPSTASSSNGSRPLAPSGVQETINREALQAEPQASAASDVSSPLDRPKKRTAADKADPTPKKETKTGDDTTSNKVVTTRKLTQLQNEVQKKRISGSAKDSQW